MERNYYDSLLSQQDSQIKSYYWTKICSLHWICINFHTKYRKTVPLMQLCMYAFRFPIMQYVALKWMFVWNMMFKVSLVLRWTIHQNQREKIAWIYETLVFCYWKYSSFKAFTLGQKDAWWADGRRKKGICTRFKLDWSVKMILPLQIALPLYWRVSQMVMALV